LLIYGTSSAAWCASSTMSRKMSQRAPPRSRGLRGPPIHEENLAVAIPDLLTVNCRNGWDESALGRFVATLQK
jgi:hypothetical protein